MIRIAKMKFLILAGVLAMFCALVCPAGRADDLSITLDNPVVGSAGDVITVFGDITNNTSSTIFFVDDSLSPQNPGEPLSGTADVVFNALLFGGPASVDPGTPLTGVDLFTLMIDPGAAPGVYAYSYTLRGSTDPGCADETCENPSVLSFNVTVNGTAITPEPGSFVLLACGLLAGLLVARRAGR